MTYSVPKYVHRYMTLDFIFQVPKPAALSSVNPNRTLTGLPILGMTGTSDSSPTDPSIRSHTPFQDQDLKARPMYCRGHNCLLAAQQFHYYNSLVQFHAIRPKPLCKTQFLQVAFCKQISASAECLIYSS